MAAMLWRNTVIKIDNNPGLVNSNLKANKMLSVMFMW